MFVLFFQSRNVKRMLDVYLASGNVYGRLQSERGGGGGEGVLYYKSLVGMCRSMGSHFHNWNRVSKWEEPRIKRSESCCSG